MNYKCKKCGNDWVSRVVLPKSCPKCKTYKWDTPKIIIEEKDVKK
jgi:predicted Zn-ribbon and HTH transcriptional regulator